MEGLKWDDIVIKQLSTCLYFIDHFALRVGNEKDTDTSADTAGVWTLKVKNIILTWGGWWKENVTLDFLGKDWMRYYKK